MIKIAVMAKRATDMTFQKLGWSMYDFKAVETLPNCIKSNNKMITLYYVTEDKK